MDLVDFFSKMPENATLYSPLFGEMIFQGLDKENIEWPIIAKPYLHSRDEVRFRRNGSCDSVNECCLFPSKECRDWEKYINNPPNLKFKEIKWGPIYWCYLTCDYATDMVILKNVGQKVGCVVDDKYLNEYGTLDYYEDDTIAYTWQGGVFIEKTASDFGMAIRGMGIELRVIK